MSQATGLLSHTSDLLSGGTFDWAMPNPPIVWDASFKQLIFAIQLRLLSFLRGFIPPIVLNLFLFCIPPFVSFYELTLRRFLPQLPSILTIVFKLYKSGVLSISTVTWLMPQSMLGGLGAIGGAAMGGATAFASGATALVGGATAGASAVVGGVAGLATNGLSEAAGLMGGAANGITEGLSHIRSGELQVAENLSHFLSEQGAAAGLAPTAAKDAIQATVGNTNALAQEVLQATVGNTSAVAKDAIQAAVGTTHALTDAALQSVTNPVAAIGATQAAMTENATKLAHALDSVNPLSNLIPSTDPQHGVLGNILHPKLPGLS